MTTGLVKETGKRCCGERVAISGGVADSINPRTVGPARYRATTRKRVVSVMLSTIGVFTVTLAAGILLLLAYYVR